MHFERRNAFQNAYDYIFPEKKIEKKYVCLPYLTFSEHTYFFFIWPSQNG